MENYGRLTGKQPKPNDYHVGPFQSDEFRVAERTSMEDFWPTSGRLESKVDNPLKKEAAVKRE
ncbi:MAG: hypothetical protein AABX29_01585 [Nanoarchaeota archaeon]